MTCLLLTTGAATEQAAFKCMCKRAAATAAPLREHQASGGRTEGRVELLGQPVREQRPRALLRMRHLRRGEQARHVLRRLRHRAEGKE